MGPIPLRRGGLGQECVSAAGGFSGGGGIDRWAAAGYTCLVMAEIREFRGLRYNPAKVPELGSILCPPYDVISPEEQEQLYRRHDYNAVRLELARGGDRYDGAAETLARWRREGVLIQEEQPAVYLTRHEFHFQGRPMARTELTTGVRLEALAKGVVRPHEDTTARAKEDRLNLMLATEANISSVMLLSEGSEALLGALEEGRRGAPVEADLGDGERFLTWPISERHLIGQVREALASRPLYIADGHHRYETALAYRDKVAAAAARWTGEEAANFVMAALIDFSDPGLLMLPYHRLLRGLDAEALGRLRERTGALCQGESFPMGEASPAEIARRALQDLTPTGSIFAAWGLEPGCLSLLRLRSPQAIEALAGKGHSPAWAGLATTIFREAVLLPSLGLHEEEAESRGLLTFAEDAAEAVQKVAAREYQVTFLLRPMPLHLLKELSDRGERLPPKSTFFFPKLPTGLVINPLEGLLGLETDGVDI